MLDNKRARNERPHHQPHGSQQARVDTFASSESFEQDTLTIARLPLSIFASVGVLSLSSLLCPAFLPNFLLPRLLSDIAAAFRPVLAFCLVGAC